MTRPISSRTRAFQQATTAIASIACGFALGVAISRWHAPPLLSSDPTSPPVHGFPPKAKHPLDDWDHWTIFGPVDSQDARAHLESTGDVLRAHDVDATASPDRAWQLRRELRPLRAGQLVAVQIDVRGDPGSRVSIRWFDFMATPVELLPETILPLTPDWQRFQIWRRLDNSGHAPACCLQFHCPGGECELRQPRFAEGDWLAQFVALPRFQPGETRAGLLPTIAHHGETTDASR